MIRFSCPSCEAVLEAPESKGGGIMCCPECDQKMQVPDAPEKPSRRGRDDDDVEEAEDIVEDLEEVDEGDERSNGKGKSTAITSAPSKKKSAGARATTTRMTILPRTTRRKSVPRRRNGRPRREAGRPWWSCSSCWES